MIRAMSVTGVAAMTGLPLGTVRSMVARGVMPPADVEITSDGREPVRGWTRDTIEAWLAERTAAGAWTKATAAKLEQARGDDRG